MRSPSRCFVDGSYVVYVITALTFLIKRKITQFKYSVFSIGFFFFSSRRRHTRFKCDWSSDVCSSDLIAPRRRGQLGVEHPARVRGAVLRRRAGRGGGARSEGLSPGGHRAGPPGQPGDRKSVV